MGMCDRVPAVPGDGEGSTRPPARVVLRSGFLGDGPSPWGLNEGDGAHREITLMF